MNISDEVIFIYLWQKIPTRKKGGPSVVERNGDIISKARAAVTEETIRDWFKNLRENLHKEDVEDGKLLGSTNYKDFYVISSDLEILCNFSAAGMIVPSMMIVPYKRVPQDMTFSTPDSYFLGRLDSGRMESETFYLFYAVNYQKRYHADEKKYL
ncbi:hypothetical protein FQR65_LT00012 [Abscondita terminalis]|nr:hypothetical protein FQR65_LT00012 [Abscondita terminalis]